ncbi:hypothetical protein ACWEQ8_01075 [Streptomyces noursei]
MSARTWELTITARDKSRRGLGSNLFQIRPMADFDSPVLVAMEALDQCASLL